MSIILSGFQTTLSPKPKTSPNLNIQLVAMSKPAKTVLITGCTKGSIGYSLAKEFAAHNYHVYATSRRIETMGDLSSIPNITLLALDLTSSESLHAAHAQISKENDGKLDILYHNAGYRSLAMAVETSFEETLKMYNANLFGIVETNRIFADLIIASRGRIVFTGSVSGYTPQPSQSVYNSSKSAMEMYARTLRMEMKPLGVRVVIVVTAGVKTGMSSDRLKLTPGRKSSSSHIDRGMLTVVFQNLITHILRGKRTGLGRSLKRRIWTRIYMLKQSSPGL
jgi:NAD(P)-dependent dehydrogenase (short-subunit alcohol dehydrogenase family)